MNKSKVIFYEIVCISYILLFVYAAASKLIDIENFRIQIGQSPILTKFTEIITLAVPIIELIISILLSISKTKNIGLYLSLSLMTMFSTYIIYILRLDEHIPCACGGVLQNMGWSEHLVFNLSFIVIAILAILIKPNDSKSISDLSPTNNWIKKFIAINREMPKS